MVSIPPTAAYIPADAMDILLAPVHFFLMHPTQIGCVAGLFFVGAVYYSVKQQRALPIAVAAVAWALFAMWESYCKQQGYNIRLDLVVILPVMFVLTGWGLQALFQRQHVAPDADND